MTRRLIVAFAAVALATAGLVPATARADCAPQPQRKYDRQAEVIVKGRFLDGPSAPDGTLLSPATFRVREYVKGDGPRRLEVATSVRAVDGGFEGISVLISPEAGERWRLPGKLREKRKRLLTSECDGAKRLRRAR